MDLDSKESVGISIPLQPSLDGTRLRVQPEIYEVKKRSNNEVSMRSKRNYGSS